MLPRFINVITFFQIPLITRRANILNIKIGNPTLCSPLIIAAFLLTTINVAAVEFMDGSWYIAPSIAYVDDDKNRDGDDGLAYYQLAVGKQLNTKSAIEFTGDLMFINADGFDADQKSRGLGVQYVRKFSDLEYFEPYALIGAGIVSSQNKNPLVKDAGGITSTVGIGVLTPLSVFDLFLRTELRLRSDYSASTLHDYMLSFGVQRSLSPKSLPILDRDHDGVNDSKDRCGDTPADSDIDDYGCARDRITQ